MSSNLYFPSAITLPEAVRGGDLDMAISSSLVE